MRDEINYENVPAIYGEAVPRHQTNPCVWTSPDITRSMRPMKIAAHPVRLKILLAIGGDEVSVQDIATMIGIEPNSVSKHLALLFDNGVVASRKDANRIYYHVTDAVIQKAIGLALEIALSSSATKNWNFSGVMFNPALVGTEIAQEATS